LLFRIFADREYFSIVVCECTIRYCYGIFCFAIF